MENQICQITHYYNGISVAVLSLTDTLELGDKIHFLGTPPTSSKMSHPWRSTTKKSTR